MTARRLHRRRRATSPRPDMPLPISPPAAGGAFARLRRRLRAARELFGDGGRRAAAARRRRRSIAMPSPSDRSRSAATWARRGRRAVGPDQVQQALVQTLAAAGLGQPANGRFRLDGQLLTLEPALCRLRHDGDGGDRLAPDRHHQRRRGLRQDAAGAGHGDTRRRHRQQQSPAHRRSARDDAPTCSSSCRTSHALPSR